jgi:hypothetical protein
MLFYLAFFLHDFYYFMAPVPQLSGQLEAGNSVAQMVLLALPLTHLDITSESGNESNAQFDHDSNLDFDDDIDRDEDEDDSFSD